MVKDCARRAEQMQTAQKNERDIRSPAMQHLNAFAAELLRAYKA
jgi:hypothetical protein